MASTYTSRLRLVRPTTGELTNTWGDVFNQQFSDLLDQAVAGFLTINMADADIVLTASNGAGDQARYAMINFTGALTANRTITVPAVSKIYFIGNNTTGGFKLKITTGSGLFPLLPNTGIAAVGCDGTNTFYLTSIISEETTINNYPVGYLEVPQNRQSADYTLVLLDSGKHIYHPGSDSTARTWTIPANASIAFPIGTTITFVNELNAGVITLQIASDTMVFSGHGVTGTRTMPAGTNATAMKTDTTTWMISGTGIT